MDYTEEEIATECARLDTMTREEIVAEITQRKRRMQARAREMLSMQAECLLRLGRVTTRAPLPLLHALADGRDPEELGPEQQ